MSAELCNMLVECYDVLRALTASSVLVYIPLLRSLDIEERFFVRSSECNVLS